jgi:hypothetical protein
VPEQFAGQLMKCPLCAGTFTVPGLPPASTSPPAPTGPAPAPLPQHETFGLKDPAPAVPPVTTPEPLPPIQPPHDMPADATFGTDLSTGTTTTPKPTLPPAGYSKTRSYPLDGKIMKYVPASCVVLIFILTFFPWVGAYPGGVAVRTQSAWGAAFGGYTDDEDLAPKEKEKEKDSDEEPGVSVFLIFYVLLFPLVLLATIAVLLMHMNVFQPPAALQSIMPWRWGIIAALNILLFLFLGGQLLFDFSLESKYKDKVEKQFKDARKEAKKEADKKKVEMQVGLFLTALRRTFWLRLVVLLQLITIAGAAQMFWLDRRNDPEHPPKIECVY